MLAIRRTLPMLSSRTFSTSARASMAKISIIGNLAGPPTLEATSTGHEIIKYSVASNSGTKDNRHTSWFNIASFVEEGARRDFLTSLDKGTLVYVEGDARMNSYEDKEGKKQSSLSIIQRQIEILKRPEARE